MNAMRIAAVATLIAAAMLASTIWFRPGLLLLLPIVVSAVVVLWFRPDPARAGFLGGAGTAGVYVALSLAGTFILFLLGDLANDDGACDAFCHNNAEGLLVNSVVAVLFAVPMAIAGAIVSSLIAFATRSGSSRMQTE